MRAVKKLGLLATAVSATLILASCGATNPGGSGDSGGGGSSGGGTSSATQASAQQKFQSTSGPYCKPPGNITSKDFSNLTVGFSQSEKETNPFRSTETESVRQAAKDRGIKLAYANAQSQQSKQVSDIKNLLSQNVGAMIIAPLQSNGLGGVLGNAGSQDVPVVLIDRETAATPCKDYISQIQSDFVRQGELAAQYIDENTDGTAKIAVLEGSPGASVTNDRTKGFKQYVNQHSDSMQIVASQTANFVRTDGQQVMEQLVQANSDINAVYAENDEMALGAIPALKSAGKKPGKDVVVVGTDGSRDAAQAIVDGDMSATVTTNPRFGPIAFKTLKQYFSGKKVPQKIRVKDELVDSKNAQKYLNGGAY